MAHENLWDIASHFYKPSGANQLPHIKRVYDHACFIRGVEELNQEEAIAVIFHDFTKSSVKGVPHGVSAARHLPRVLRKYGVQLSADGLVRICEAIASHDDNKRKSPSELADLLRSADALPPNLGQYLFKAFNKSLASEGTPEGAYARVLKAVRSKRPVLKHMECKPHLYFLAYGISGIKAALKDIEACQTPEDVQHFIDQYLDANPGADPEV